MADFLQKYPLSNGVPVKIDSSNLRCVAYDFTNDSPFDLDIQWGQGKPVSMTISPTTLWRGARPSSALLVPGYQWSGIIYATPTYPGGGTPPTGAPAMQLTVHGYEKGNEPPEQVMNLNRLQNIGNIVSTANALAGIFNVKDPAYGATGNGTTDDTLAIQAAITAASVNGGIVLFPVGTYLLSSAIVLNQQNVRLVGQGGRSILQPSPTFSGAAIVSITADFCGVLDMKIAFANANSGTNPAADGIAVSGARFTVFERLQIFTLNGWAMTFTNNAAVNVAGGVLHSIHVNHCAKGIHVLSAAAANYVGQLYFDNIHLEALDNGDGLFLEDVQDIEIVNLNGAVAGGAVVGSLVHIKGNCNAHFITNIDAGVISACTVTNGIILVENGANGVPANISFVNGVVQKGLPNILVSDGQDIAFCRIKSKTSQGDGYQDNATGVCTLEDCVFITNNQTNITAYDINILKTGSNTYVKHCRCETPVGAGAGLVTNPMNDTNHRAYVFGCAFVGTGTTSSNVFAGTPQIVRSSVGYNPRGNITAPTIGASPFTTNTSQNDVEIIFTAINSLTAFKISGTAVGVLPVAGVPYHVPARSSVELDYSAAAPAWQWFAD